MNPVTDRVLITGAAGAIGTALRNGLRADWRHLRLTDARPIADPAAERGVHCRRHRRPRGDRAHDAGRGRGRAPGRRRRRLHAGGSVPGQRARPVRRVRGGAAGRRAAHRVRLVSNHAFGCYPINERVSPALPPRPDSLYGTFKAWGETMLRGYFDRHGIRSVSLRIGTYRPLPIDQRSLATWLSPGDVARLVDAALRHPDPGCLVVNGYSDNTRHQDVRPELGVPGLPPAGQRRGPPRDAARQGRRRGRPLGVAGARRLARPRAGAAAGR